jgi:hypothetical protein
MANFCLATKMSPSEYRKLTLAEVNAYVSALEKRGSQPALDLEELI